MALGLEDEQKKIAFSPFVRLIATHSSNRAPNGAGILEPSPTGWVNDAINYFSGLKGRQFVWTVGSARAVSAALRAAGFAAQTG